jgi:3-oxoacyl-[acyl-carrier protein] reductase
MISLEGRTALITGASRGIGRATAEYFVRAGARVVIHYHQSELEARDLWQELCSSGRQHLLWKADVSKATEVEQLFHATLDTFQHLDVLVANAGIWEGRGIDELTEAEWDRTMAINLKSMYLCCHHAARIMKKQGSGNIITISSTAGQRGEAFHSDYAASKGAIISLTKSLAVELGPYGVRVNCVAPGWVDTDMAASALRNNPEESQRIAAAIPLGQVATAADIAGPILFLASELARHVHGEVLNVNGGSVLCG